MKWKDIIEDLLILALFVLSGVCILRNVQFYFLPQLLTFFTFFILPGWIILRNFTFGEIAIGEFLILSSGISTFLFIVLGLTTSLIYPLLHIQHPLSPVPFLITLAIVLIPFFLRVYLFKSSLPPLPKVSINWSSVLAYLTILFPIATIAGTQILNNGGTNSLIICLLLGIGIFVVFLCIISTKISPQVYPFSIFSISLSLLWMYSLRSSHVFGSDINTELRIFEITQNAGVWSLTNVVHAYNATLSVAILPVIWQFLLHIPNEYVLKLIEPVIFSIVPVTIYYIVRQFALPFVAFLSSFFFMAQFQFMQQMPAITRQEIAFVFFTLGVYVLFSTLFATRIKNTLFILFAIGMVLSHYTTSYLAVGIYIATFSIVTVWEILAKKITFLKIPFVRKEPLQFMSVIILTLFTYFWYGQYTSTIDYLSTFAKNTYSAVKDHGGVGKSQQAQVAFGGSAKGYTSQDVSTYQQEVSETYKKNRPWINFYDPSTYTTYDPSPKYPTIISIKNYPMYTATLTIFNVVKLVMKLSSIVGIIYLIFLLYKRKTIVPSSYVVMVSVFAMIVVASVVIPFISVAYNIERLYQQALVVLGFPIILGGVWAMLWTKRFSYIPVTLLVVYYFMFYAGIISQFVGGGAYLNLNNFGEDYDRFYTHDSEVASAHWLNSQWDKVSLIYADEYAMLRLQASTKISYGIVTDVSPYVIDKFGFVYSDYANTVEKTARATFQNSPIIYSFPQEFLDTNKNLVYSNGKSVIYK